MRGGIQALALGMLAGLAGCASGPKTAPPVPVTETAPKFDANNPPQGIFDDEWMNVSIGGQKAGYAHETLRREGDTVFTDSRIVLRIGREANVAAVEEADSTEETVSGEPRAFRSATTLASQPAVVAGRGDGLTFNVTVKSGSYQEQRVVTLPAGTLMEWGAEKRQLLEGLKPGTRYEILMYSPADDLLKPLPTEVVVGPKEKVSVGGATVEATRVDENIGTQSAAGTLREVSWVDDTGEDLKTLLPMGGFTMEMTATTQAAALADYLPADIFTASLIELRQLVPEGATTVTYDLKRSDGQALPRPPESSTEKAEVRPDGSVRITLTRAGAAAPGGKALSAAELAPYLARNSYLDTSDPALRKLAAEAGGPADAPPGVVAQRLRDFVAGYIDKKDLSVAFATATEVAKSREGDCTEHAVLLAALGRVRGLPTRVVAGLAYVPEYEGKEAILGYHMWAQFYINGQWVDYDAALPELAGPPRRLGLSASGLESESLADFSLGLLNWMAGLQVTVEKAESE